MKNHCRILRYPVTRVGKLFLLVLTLAGIALTSDAYAQINAYAKVTAISGKVLTLSNINQTYHSFAAGEPVILIQMKDAVIGSNTGNNTSFGTVAAIASAGLYEMSTISTIAGSTMTLTANPVNTYHTGSNSSVQVVSFNILSSINYTTSSAITAVPWNGNVGGIVAFQVGGTLTLSNSVSADALGFRGGSGSSNYESTCEPAVYDNTSSNYGYKGEGIEGSSTITYTTHTGRGPLVSGGGGGSDDNGGGAGGGNYTAGGDGGQGWTCSSTTAAGGIGGIGLGTYIAGGRVFMGGGGGGGQQNNGVGSAGTSGGGIVFIKANKLVTSCSGSVSISAAGGSSANSGNDGAGGAGGGGSVVLAITTFAVSSGCPLNITASGGDGGSVTDPGAHGGGGGGGQGAVIFSASLPTSNITTVASNGTGGLNSSSGGATRAGSGGGTNNGGIMSGVPILLPVNFLAFSAVKNGQQNMLSWVTSRLTQYVQFTVQRSADGGLFQDIGTLDGIVDGRSTENYAFTDGFPLSGKNFYRVKEVDASGAEKYTAIVLVDWTSATAAFHVSPNPAQGSFTVQLMNATTEAVSVSLEDMSGKTVYHNMPMVTGGKVPVLLNKSLPTGIYLVRVVTKTGTETGKIILR